MTPEQQKIHDDWLARLNQLVDDVEHWACEFDWSTRRIEKRLDDAEIGKHLVPVLLLQEETVRLMLEPITRSAPGAEGVVDLCLMPAYDDIASLYFAEGKWRLYYMRPGTPEDIRETDSPVVSKEALLAVMEEMKRHAATAT